MYHTALLENSSGYNLSLWETQCYVTWTQVAAGKTSWLLLLQNRSSLDLATSFEFYKVIRLRLWRSFWKLEFCKVIRLRLWQSLWKFEFCKVRQLCWSPISQSILTITMAIFNSPSTLKCANFHLNPGIWLIRLYNHKMIPFHISLKGHH